MVKTFFKWLLLIFYLLGSVKPLLAGLVFDTKLIEAISEPTQQEIEIVFPFQVIERMETIVRMDAPCDCLGATLIQGGLEQSLPIKLASGKLGEIRVKFRTTGFRGVIDKAIFLWISGQQEAIRLTVRLRVPAILELDRPSHAWLVGAKAKLKNTILTINYKKPIAIKSHRCVNPAFRYEIETLKKGLRYQVKVEALDTSKPSLGFIDIETDCPYPAFSKCRVILLVKK